MKKEFNHERRTLEQKLYEMETEKNLALKNEKVLENRLVMIQDERDKQDRTIHEKHRQQIEDKEDQVRDLEYKIRQFENQLRQIEDDNFKRFSESEKLNALIE